MVSLADPDFESLPTEEGSLTSGRGRCLTVNELSSTTIDPGQCWSET